MKIFSKQLLMASTDAGGIPKGTVIFESATAGMYSVDLPEDGLYEIIAVGGGGGAGLMAIGGQQYTIAVAASGGSGAVVHGIFKVNAGTQSVIVGALGASATMAAAGVAASTAGGSTSVGLLCSVNGGGRGLAGFGNPVTQEGGAGGTVASYDSSALTSSIKISSGTAGTYNRWWTGNKDGTVSVSTVASPYPPYGAGSGGSATTRYYRNTVAGFSHSYGSAGYVKIIYQGKS